MPFDKVLTQANNNSYRKQPLNPHLLNLRSYGATPIIHLPFIIKFEPSALKLVSLVAFYCNIWTQLLLILIALIIYAWKAWKIIYAWKIYALYHITCGDLNTPHYFCDITHQCFAGKKLKNLNFFASGIYRSYYVRGLQYMPPRVLALWGQNPAGAMTWIRVFDVVEQHKCTLYFYYKAIWFNNNGKDIQLNIILVNLLIHSVPINKTTLMPVK
jgi:hypothetical protein